MVASKWHKRRKRVSCTCLAFLLLGNCFGFLGERVAIAVVRDETKTLAVQPRENDMQQGTYYEREKEIGELAPFVLPASQTIAPFELQSVAKALEKAPPVIAFSEAALAEASRTTSVVHTNQRQGHLIATLSSDASILSKADSENSLFFPQDQGEENHIDSVLEEDAATDQDAEQEITRIPEILPDTVEQPEESQPDEANEQAFSQILFPGMAIYDGQGTLIEGSAIDVSDAVRLGPITGGAITGMLSGQNLGTTPVRLQNIGEYQESPVDVLLSSSAPIRLQGSNANGLNFVILSDAATAIDVRIQAVYAGTDQLIPAPIVFGVALQDNFAGMQMPQNQLQNFGILQSQRFLLSYSSLNQQHVFQTIDTLYFGIKATNNSQITMTKRAGLQGVSGRFILFDRAGLETIPLQKGTVHVHHVDTFGQPLAPSEEVTGVVGGSYQTKEKEIQHYQLTKEPENARGVITEEDIEVTYVYRTLPVSPKDPLAPEEEAAPENGGQLPEEQGLVSIDFVSQFRFGQQKIAAQDKSYYAQPQTIVIDPETNETAQRPNYIQVSDRREVNTGWRLNVQQTHQFVNEHGHKLQGAALWMSHQELLTTEGGTPPSLAIDSRFDLRPGVSETLIWAVAHQGKGTWIYRFGDEKTAGSAIELSVPASATPETGSYKTTLEWQLTAAPLNESIDYE